MLDRAACKLWKARDIAQSAIEQLEYRAPLTHRPFLLSQCCQCRYADAEELNGFALLTVIERFPHVASQSSYIQCSSRINLSDLLICLSSAHRSHFVTSRPFSTISHNFRKKTTELLLLTYSNFPYKLSALDLPEASRIPGSAIVERSTKNPPGRLLSFTRAESSTSRYSSENGIATAGLGMIQGQKERGEGIRIVGWNEWSVRKRSYISKAYIISNYMIQCD